jgi:hypothetical protein
VTGGGDWRVRQLDEGEPDWFVAPDPAGLGPVGEASGGWQADDWYRVQVVMPGSGSSSPERDYAAVLPAALRAARRGRPLVSGWFCRGHGAPLELITSAGPVPPAPISPRPDSHPPVPPALTSPALGLDGLAGPSAGPGEFPAGLVELLFPWGARGTAAGTGLEAELGQLVWAPCPGRLAPLAAVRPGAPDGTAGGPEAWAGPRVGDGSRPGLGPPPGRFEAALTTLMTRPFGWLVVAEPAGPVDAEAADLRTQLNVLRRYDEEQARFESELAQRRLAELDSFREAGLWRVRVLAGAASRAELELIAPVLVGALDLREHPYRLHLPDLLGAGTGSAAAGPPTGPAASRARPAGGAPGGHPAGSVAGWLAGGSAAGQAEEAGGWFGADWVANPGAANYGPADHGPADYGAAGYGTAGYGTGGDWAADEEADGAPGGARVPFMVTAGALVALAGLPSAEVPGVRVAQPGFFDLTSETGGPGAIGLGTILDAADRPVGTFSVPLPTLNRHSFITGATGAGKSQTVRHLLQQLSEAGLPWLAIEPVKSEYAVMAGRLSGMADGRGPVTVINPADPAAVPLSVNPLAPEPGYPVQAHIDMVRALFLAAFDAHEPFPQIIAQALQRVYASCGWDPVTGQGPPGAAAVPGVPTLAGLQEAALEVIDEVGYGPELRADVRGFVDVRLRSLRIGSAGRFFEGGHPADISALLAGRVVLAIEDVANDEDKAFLIGTLIIRIVEHLRLRSRAGQRGGLRHVIVIEEAHRLLRAGREGASAHAVELFAGLLAEIRAYGTGIVVAEQIPAKLVPDVVKNTALKVVHRLPAADDRQVVGAAMNLDDDQSRQVVSLRPGEAAVFADGMDRPLRIRVPFGEASPAVWAARPHPDGPVAGRRSAACGPVCRSGRPCTLLQIRQADLLADGVADAWLRIWAEALTLAFLTGRTVPAVPPPLRQRWAELDPRLRECALATVTERVLRGRTVAIRACYDPGLLAAAVAAAARELLAGHPGHPAPPGPDWVIPPLRWLHEIERACPLGQDIDPRQPAQPLEYELPGLADRPGVLTGQRIAGLRRHPLSMALPGNRRSAWTVLLGAGDQRELTDDLAAVVIGADHTGQLRAAAAAMGIAGWLETVLSWPRRFIVAGDDPGSAAFQPGAPAR